MKTIKIYCGESIQNLCGKQVHPVTEVKRAEILVNSKYDIIDHSNSSDFIFAVNYMSKKQNIQAEFFLNGISTGNDIEPILADLDRALDMINDLGISLD